jgi:hypothetical protein
LQVEAQAEGRFAKEDRADHARNSGDEDGDGKGSDLAEVLGHKAQIVVDGEVVWNQ